MRYKQSVSPSLSVPPVSGAQVGGPPAQQALIPWQPSTWPPPPGKVDTTFIKTLEKIFNESILDEIGNVINDAKKKNGDLQHRGHVVAISLMCALDAISAYGYRGREQWRGGNHIEDFVRNHFPRTYRPYARDICTLYRNSLVHSWNLFEASILPGKEVIRRDASLSFGLLNFLAALRSATKDYLRKLKTKTPLQKKTLERYEFLKQSARP